MSATGASLDELSGQGEAAPAAAGLGERPFAAALCLFLLLLFTDTDIFLHDVLGHLGATLRPNGAPNFKGSVIRAVFVVVAACLVMLLLAHGVL